MEKVWERPEFIQRMKEARNDPIFLEEQAERLRERWKDESHREKMLSSRWTEEAKTKQAAALEARRDKMLAAMTPEIRAKQGSTLKQWWENNPDPDHGKKCQAGITPEGKKRHSEAMKRRWAEYRERKRTA
jgi:hypothetical protein